MAFPLTRRRFLRSAVSASIAFSGLGAIGGCGNSSSGPDPLAGFDGFGELVPDPDGIMDLPAGFSYRVISEWKAPMSDGFLQPALSDGMHAFAGPNGRTILVRNHELYSDPINLGAFGEGNRLLPQVDRSRVFDWGNGKPALGGTTTVVFDTRTQTIERMFLSLVGTTRNCAGGATPWGSWVTCEEFVSLPNTVGLEKRHGFNFEVPANAQGLVQPVALEAMGRFNHEAIAVDPETGIVYQTEDRYESLFYRYIPDVPGKLAAGGRLQALVARDRAKLDTRNFNEATVAVGERIPVLWIDLEDITPVNDDLRLRGASNGAAIFARGEGMVTGADGTSRRPPAVARAMRSAERARSGATSRARPRARRTRTGSLGRSNSSSSPTTTRFSICATTSSCRHGGTCSSARTARATKTVSSCCARTVHSTVSPPTSSTSRSSPAPRSRLTERRCS